jgi:uncharacterized protein YggE
MNRKWWVTIGAIVIVLMSVVGLVSCTSEGALSGGSLEIKGNLNSQQEGIWVNGEGKVTVVPDVAILTLGIESQETSVAVAQAKASEAMDKVKQALKAQGIADKDIQTQYFNISQITQWESDKQLEKVTGYRVTNTVTVKVRDVEKTGAVIDAAVTAGGDMTRINGISFTVDEPAPYYVQARDLAITHAAAKAQQLAVKSGIKLGKVTYITESSYNYGPITRNYVMGDSAMAVPAPAVTTPVSVGELEITATVQIAYDID